MQSGPNYQVPPESLGQAWETLRKVDKATEGLSESRNWFDIPEVFNTNRELG
jgi:hypothetical protein